MIRVWRQPVLAVVSRNKKCNRFPLCGWPDCDFINFTANFVFGWYCFFHSGNHSSKGNITHVSPSNLHCKYAWMQSAHETMDIAPCQSVKLSAAIAVGVVAVSFSEKKTSWSPIWFVILSIAPIHTSFVLLCIGYIRQDFSNLDILTGLSRSAFQQVKRNDRCIAPCSIWSKT